FSLEVREKRLDSRWPLDDFDAFCRRTSRDCCWASDEPKPSRNDGRDSAVIEAERTGRAALGAAAAGLDSALDVDLLLLLFLPVAFLLVRVFLADALVFFALASAALLSEVSALFSAVSKRAMVSLNSSTFSTVR